MGKLIETFAIALPGRPLTGRLYRTPYRDCGRRITVSDPAGAVVFDTDDCYDLGNARSTLEGWLAAQS